MTTSLPSPSPSTGHAAADGGPGVLRLLALALGVATVAGVVSTLLLRLTTVLVGTPVPWSQAASGWVDWYVWAALTPAVVWLARAVPIRAGAWRRSVATHVVLGAAVGLVELALFALAMTVYGRLFFDFALPPFGARYLSLVGRWLPVQMLIYALIVAVVSAIDNGRRARARDVRSARLETELSRAQLHALQAQIQPHFLFNTMNTISMAVREGRSDDAVQMMAHLGGILRRSITAAVQPHTDLRGELEFVHHYLRLESWRMEDRLEVEWDVEPEVLDARVPSMLLQPLVENAVRHGLAELPEGGTLALRGERRDGRVRLTVEDDGAGLPPDAPEGTGLGNVRRRLETRYGPAATLTLASRAGGGTVVTITLPWEPHEPSTEPDHPRPHR